MSTTVNKRVTATLQFPVSISAFIIYVRGIILKLTGNPNVPTPYPTLTSGLATSITNCNTLESAEALVQTHVTGSKAARDTAHEICKKDMRSIRNMVQQLADNNTSATVSSTSIITSAGFGVRTVSGPLPQVFGVKNTLVSGKIKLLAPSNAGGKGSHKWFLTTDTVGFTGKVALPETTKASTSVEGLVAGTKYAFFHSALTSTGLSTEEGPIFLIVI